MPERMKKTTSRKGGSYAWTLESFIRDGSRSSDLRVYFDRIVVRFDFDYDICRSHWRVSRLEGSWNRDAYRREYGKEVAEMKGLKRSAWKQRIRAVSEGVLLYVIIIGAFYGIKVALCYRDGFGDFFSKIRQ